MAYETGKPGGPAGPEAAEASDYEAYQFIVQAVSKAITDGVKDSLEALQQPENFQQKLESTIGPEATPSPESVKDLWRGFWSVATGLDCDIRWRNVSGVPERSAVTVAEIKPNLEELGPEVTEDPNRPEWGISVGAFGFNVGLQF